MCVFVSLSLSLCVCVCVCVSHKITSNECQRRHLWLSQICSVNLFLLFVNFHSGLWTMRFKALHVYVHAVFACMHVRVLASDDSD